MGNEEKGNVGGSATVNSHRFTVNNDLHRWHLQFPSFMHPTKWINDTITTTGADGYSHVTTVQMLQKGSILKIWEVAIN